MAQVVLSGEVSSGKSCLLQRLTGGGWDEQAQRPTIGMETKAKQARLVLAPRVSRLAPRPRASA